MKQYFEQMKNIQITEPIVTIKSRLNDTSLDQLIELANKMTEK